jgi:hypothetical protein
MSHARRGYPLGILFVIVTACAVLVAGFTPLVQLALRGQIEAATVLLALAIGAGWGLFIGGVTGLIQFRSLLGGLTGAGAGLLIGGAAGLIALLPAQELTAAATAMTAGSAMIIGVALLMRHEPA